MKEKLWVDWPNDVRPSRHAAFGAHLGTIWEMGWPVVLLLSSGGTIGTIAVVAMVLFHIHITSTFALGVPLEWNLFMIFGLLFLFGHYGDVPLSTLDPVLLAIIVVVGVLIPVLGNLFPDKISFLPSMRYYAGNWATSKWMFRKDTDAEGKFDRDLYKVAPINGKQLEGMYDAETASYMIDGGLAFRALHSHGRALTGLLNRAAPGDVDDYYVREGELVSGLANGWNFGDGHFHHKQLLDAVQEQVPVRARRRARDRPRVPAGPHPAPALPDLRRRHRRCSRRAGSTSPTCGRAAPGSRATGTSRSRSSEGDRPRPTRPR